MASDNRLLEALVTIHSISNDKGLEFGQKLHNVLLETVRGMEARSGSIMLVKGRKYLEVVASMNADLKGVRQYLDEESPSTWVVKHSAPLYVENVSKSDIFREKFETNGGCALLLTPIMSNEKVIGVLSVTDKRGKVKFSKEEQQAFLSIAGQTIGALENQRLAESLKRKRRKNLQFKKLEGLKTDFFNMLVHDLKGPISDIIANLDILSYTVSDENREYVEFAKIGCESLYRMVSNILDIAKLDEGRLQLIYEKIDPEDLIRETLERLFGLGTIKELSFVKKFPSTKTVDFFWGDRGILLRIMQNLLTNAIDYSPSGESIEVGFEYLKSQKIKFFVVDKGPGVPPEYQKNIFDKYFQLEKRGEERAYSTGLGLAFCQMAVKAHGGKIDVKSEGLKGSRFSFTLPLERKEGN